MCVCVCVCVCVCARPYAGIQMGGFLSSSGGPKWAYAWSGGGGGGPGACSPRKILVLCSQDPAVLCILAVKTG